MAEKVLDQPCIGAFIGERVSGGVSQHVRMNVETKIGFVPAAWFGSVLVSTSIRTCCDTPTGYALANEGTDTRLIQDFLGHASIANTVRYTRLAPGRLAAVRVR